MPLPLGSARERHSRGVLPSRTALSQTMAASIHRAPSSARRQRAGEDVSDWQPGLEAVAFRLWTRVTASPATRATARPAVMSLQGSIEQECVTVQGDVSAAHMGLKLEKLLPSASFQNFAVKASFRRSEKDNPQSARGSQRLLFADSTPHFRQSWFSRGLQNASHSYEAACGTV